MKAETPKKEEKGGTTPGKERVKTYPNGLEVRRHPHLPSRRWHRWHPLLFERSSAVARRDCLMLVLRGVLRESVPRS